jgi:hypothetical protein
MCTTKFAKAKAYNANICIPLPSQLKPTKFSQNHPF